MKGIHQRINLLAAIEFGGLREMGVTDGGQNRAVAEDFLDFQQVNPCFNQMGGITMA